MIQYSPSSRNIGTFLGPVPSHLGARSWCLHVSLLCNCLTKWGWDALRFRITLTSCCHILFRLTSLFSCSGPPHRISSLRQEKDILFWNSEFLVFHLSLQQLSSFLSNFQSTGMSCWDLQDVSSPVPQVTFFSLFFFYRANEKNFVTSQWRKKKGIFDQSHI